MCGIVGYVGRQNAANILLEGLASLEYRGYDSAGISLVGQTGILTLKAQGRLQNLIDRCHQAQIPDARCGIGHTRWATHGEPSDINAHPHGTAGVSLVHNGIIENYLEIKDQLTSEGYTFDSETDTEVAAKLADHYDRGDPIETIVRMTERLEGSYAFGIVFADRPDTLYAVRKSSPLIVGLGEGENFIASDVPAILQHTRRYYLLDELEIAEVRADSVVVRTPDGQIVHKSPMIADWDCSQAQKCGYPHFMLKEIYEQPRVLMDTIHPRVRNGFPDFTADGLSGDFFRRFRKVIFVACGTAMHAGAIGKSLIEKLARVPVEVDCASEFRYRDPILTPETLVIAISQSGETADTLAALRLAKFSGIATLAIINVTGSSIAREADYVLHTYAGPEISVASTKAFSVQVGILYLIAAAFARTHGVIDDDGIRKTVQDLLNAIGHTTHMLDLDHVIRELAPRLADAHSLFYMGRGIDHAMAMEGSLKLKEITYIHSEAYAAGELKHGAISLITDGTPVVGLATQSALLPKTISNLKEVRCRGGYVLLITKEDALIDPSIYDDILRIPSLDDLFMPLTAVIALQLLAYHVAVAKGCDVDKPRNLAKSVTVE